MIIGVYDQHRMFWTFGEFSFCGTAAAVYTYLPVWVHCASKTIFDRGWVSLKVFVPIGKREEFDSRVEGEDLGGH